MHFFDSDTIQPDGWSPSSPSLGVGDRTPDQASDRVPDRAVQRPASDMPTGKHARASPPELDRTRSDTQLELQNHVLYFSTASTRPPSGDGSAEPADAGPGAHAVAAVRTGGAAEGKPRNGGFDSGGGGGGPGVGGSPRGGGGSRAGSGGLLTRYEELLHRRILRPHTGTRPTDEARPDAGGLKGAVSRASDCSDSSD